MFELRIAEAIEEEAVLSQNLIEEGFSHAFKAGELIQEVKSMIANGSLTPEAPCDGMHSEWSSEQKDRLKDALSTVFKWKS